MSKAFMTGSHAYGTPHDQSDIDLVVMADDDTAVSLFDSNLPDQTLKAYGQQACWSMRFGKLNLLICTTQAQYDTWRDGTAKLIAMKPVTRDIACAIFSELRAKAQ